MASEVVYKLRVMELHCILARVGIHIVRYTLQILFDINDKARQKSLAQVDDYPEGEEEVKELCRQEDPLGTALIKLKDCLADSDESLLWMNYLTAKEAEAILTDYHPESVIKLIKEIPSKKLILPYLDAAYDVLLGLALQLSEPSEEFVDPDNKFFGFGMYPILNREDLNVCLVLDCLREITSCINSIQLLDQSEKED